MTGWCANKSKLESKSDSNYCAGIRRPGSSSSRTQPDPADIVQAKRRTAEKGVTDRDDALRRTNAVALSCWLFLGRPVLRVARLSLPFARNAHDLTILAVDGVEDCRAALLSPSCSALKSSHLITYPCLHL